MKSEERHKLQENVLAKWLAGTIENVRPYANAVLAVVLLAVVVIGLWRWWQQQNVSAASDAWDELYAAIAANDPATLDKIIEQNQGSEIVAWAAVLAGDIHLAEGCQEIFSNKANASRELGKAREKYLLVRNQSRTPTLRQRATFGLARAYEALGGTRQSDDELKKAAEQYGEVVKNWPKGPYAEAAKLRLDDLKRPATKSFYDKFAQFDPQPAFSQPGAKGKPLFDSKSLPEDGSVPDFSSMIKGGETAKPVKTGPADLGQDAEKKTEPAEKKAEPAEKKPEATEKKAEPASPAEKKPAK